MLRFHNGYVYTAAEGAVPLSCEVWTDGSVISYVGPKRDDAPVFHREIDLHGDLLIPGFKNAHTHSAMTFLRSLADDLPLREWLFQMVFPREERLTPECVYAFTRLAVLEYLRSGITAAFDMYFYPDAYVQAMTDSGFRSAICSGIGAGNADWTQEERNYARYNAVSPLISYKLGFHAEYTSSPELLRYISALAHERKAPVWSHNSETGSELRECMERHGMTPTAYFDSLGLFDYGGGGYHCVHATAEDVEIFRKRGLWAVTCPASNAKLASGIAPLGEMMAAGVNVAVGTDGPASNNALDMFREMYLACVMQKLKAEDASACPADFILRAAVSGGARAMGFDDCDSIAPGKQADMVRVDMSAPNMRPVHNMVKNLVYSGNPSNVRMTMVAGRILYENGEYHIGEDPELIYARAERLTKEII